MGHNGEKKVCCEFEVQRTPMRMTLRVSDDRNSLASVASVTERGKIVQFGPEEEEDTHIFNCTTGEKAMVRRKRPFWTRASSGRGRLSESRPSGPQRIPPASIVPLVGNEGAIMDVLGGGAKRGAGRRR